MITSFFKKSTPLNYSLLIISMLFFFFFYQFKLENGINSLLLFFNKTGYLLLIATSFFIINFVVKKNNLTKDSNYAAFFYLIFLLFSPSIFNNPKLLVANFFLLLALRRLISLQTLKFPKEKIFDATFWILMASIFQFWAVLFILVVYASIVFHVSRDYRNWLIPFVSFFVFMVVFTLFSLFFESNLIENYIHSAGFDLKMNFFKNSFQNVALSMYSVIVVFFWVPMLFATANRPLNIQASFKKLLLSLLISVLVFLFSPNKSIDLLMFSFFPLAALAASFIEYNNSKIQKEIVLFGCLIMGLTAYFLQL
jgi:hypothetical protein